MESYSSDSKIEFVDLCKEVIFEKQLTDAFINAQGFQVACQLANKISLISNAK